MSTRVDGWIRFTDNLSDNYGVSLVVTTTLSPWLHIDVPDRLRRRGLPGTTVIADSAG